MSSFMICICVVAVSMKISIQFLFRALYKPDCSECDAAGANKGICYFFAQLSAHTGWEG